MPSRSSVAVAVETKQILAVNPTIEHPQSCQLNFDPCVIAFTLEYGRATKSTRYLNVEPEPKAAAAGGGGG